MGHEITAAKQIAGKQHRWHLGVGSELAASVWGEARCFVNVPHQAQGRQKSKSNVEFN